MLSNFINPQQLEVLDDLQRNSEEKEFFVTMLQELTTRIKNMPATKETEEQNDPVIFLHYFTGGCDWMLIEKDINEDQNQAFGYANLGYGYEAGYISIAELLQNNVEIDLYFTPQPVSKLIK